VTSGRQRAAAIVCLLLVAAGCSRGDDDNSERSASSTAAVTTSSVPAGAPKEYVDHHADWVLPGRDYDNSRATRDSSITRAKVDTLAPAWEANFAGSLTTVPLIVGDTIYVQDGTGHIAALDRDTGKARWETEAYGTSIGPFGVAVADGRVFGMHGAKGVVAVDAQTGAQLWTRDVTATPTTGIDIQPVAIAGLVLVSAVPVNIGGIYTPGDRGIVHALDVATGAERWTLDTVDSPDLWGHPEVNSGGGAWYPPAIDTAASLVYWGTANPAPFVGTKEYPNGSSRPGPNLYTDSVVALDLQTGALRWYHQVTPHDLFDRDLVHTMIARLADGTAVVIGTGKGGEVVGLDSETGKRKWQTPVGVHHNDQLQALAEPTEITPGTYGGVLTPPATADGVVYVATVQAPATLAPDSPSYFGAEMGQADGQVTAVDAKTGKARWVTEVPGDPLGGVTVVNDLVFTALLDGEVVALDRTSGDIVWQHDAPGGINGWMAAAGDALVVPVGNANPPRIVAYRVSR
jgi:outer membrane protein assembly factor BamB